jgi:hypothetical protein
LPRNILLLSGRHSDRATITPSAEVPTLPASNLQNLQPRRVWRALTKTASLSLAFVEPVACNMLTMVGGNPTGERRVRITGAASPSALSSLPVVDTDWVNPWPSGGVPDAPDWPSWLLPVRWINESALTFWKVEIADTAVTYIDVGRLVLGPVWQPTTNFDLGGTPMSYDPRDAVAETDYGFTFTDRRARSAPRLFSVTVTAANQVEVMRGLQEIQRLAGNAGDVICCLDPGDAANFHLLSMQSRFTKAAGYTAPPAWDEDGQCWGASIDLREFL